MSFRTPLRAGGFSCLAKETSLKKGHPGATFFVHPWTKSVRANRGLPTRHPWRGPDPPALSAAQDPVGCAPRAVGAAMLGFMRGEFFAPVQPSMARLTKVGEIRYQLLLLLSLLPRFQDKKRKGMSRVDGQASVTRFESVGYASCTVSAASVGSKGADTVHNRNYAGKDLLQILI